MKVKVFYTEFKNKIVKVDDTLIHQIIDDDTLGTDATLQAIRDIEKQLGKDCSICGIWDEADENCLFEY